MKNEITRIPPQDLDAERAVIGACLMEKGAIDRIKLPPQAFYADKNKFVYDAMLSLSNRYEPIDIVTVKNELKRSETIKKAGGVIYLTECAQSVASTANLEYHAQIIYQHYAHRLMIEKMSRAVDKLYSPAEDVFDVMDQIEKETFDLIQNASSRTGRTMDVISIEWLDRLETILASDGGLMGVPSGIVPIDKILRGFQEPRLYVVAARPAMGKTDFGLECVYNSAKYGTPAAFISLEMGDLELQSRMVAKHLEISKSAFEEGWKHELTENGSTKPEIIKGVGELMKMGIHLVDAGSTKTGDLKRKCRDLVKAGVGLIVVDYLGLISLDYGSGRNKADLLGDVSRMLKQGIAKELSVPVIALHQLNRAVEQRPDKRPQLADLRDSGEIEQDADVVGFLYRPEYYGIETDDEGEATQGLCEFVLRKNRHGKTANIKMNYNPETGRFGEWQVSSGINLPGSVPF